MSEPVGVLGQTIKALLKAWDDQKAAGASREELVRNAEQTLRAAWPVTREWKYNCNTCRDTGAVVKVCENGSRCNGLSTRTDGPNQEPGKYRRLCAQHPDSDYSHDYIEPCWCQEGNRYRAGPQIAEDPVAAAARTRRGGFAKLGRDLPRGDR